MSRLESRDWLLWGAVVCALVGTAHAEFTLAQVAWPGMHAVVAAAVPGALDLYVVRAIRKGNDVLAAVLVMVAANVASYLVQAGDIPVEWPLRSAVGALAPLILWRVYRLGASPATSEAEVSPVSGLTRPSPDAGDRLIGFTQKTGETEWDAAWQSEWERMTEESQGDIWSPSPSAPDRDSSATPILTDLPSGFTPTDESPTLTAGDVEHVAHSKAYVDTCHESGEVPTVAGLRRWGGYGQARAERLLTHLGVREARK